MTTYPATRTVLFDATRIAAVVALLLSALALGVALSNRSTTAATASTGSRATTTVMTAATAGTLTRQQAIAHAMRVDAAGSKFASSDITSTLSTSTTTPLNPYASKIKIMDAHTAP